MNQGLSELREFYENKVDSQKKVFEREIEELKDRHKREGIQMKEQQ